MTTHDHEHDHDHGHEGSHGHGHDHTSGSMRALTIALGINTAFFAVELVGALYANSLTLLADAAHMLIDSGSIAIALFAAWVATRAADQKRTYGYERAEILGAAINGIALIAIVVYIAYEAVMRFQNPQPIKPLPTIIVGVIGIGTNLAAAYVLMGGRDNLNIEGVILHLLADAAGSFAAIVLGVVALFSDLYILDPAFSVVIAILVLYSAKDLIYDSTNTLLQGTPTDVDVNELSSSLRELEGVEMVIDIHAWALSSDTYACSVRLEVADSVDRDDLLDQCREAINHGFGIDHATIEMTSSHGEQTQTADIECYSSEEIPSEHHHNT